MGRLILVSNRLPVTVTARQDSVRTHSSSGGLATGLKEPHEQSGGVWIGWPGRTEHLSPAQIGLLEQQLAEISEALAELRRLHTVLSGPAGDPRS